MLLVAIDMLRNRRQQRKEQGSDIISPEDNVAIFPLAIPLLAGPAAITSVIVVLSGSTSSLELSLLGLDALTAAMAITAVILIATSLAEAYIDTRVTSVFSRITAIILAASSIQYVIDGLQTLDGLAISIMQQDYSWLQLMLRSQLKCFDMLVVMSPWPVAPR